MEFQLYILLGILAALLLLLAGFFLLGYYLEKRLELVKGMRSSVRYMLVSDALQYHPLELLPENDWFRSKVLDYYYRTGLLMFVSSNYKVYIINFESKSWIYLFDLNSSDTIKKKIEKALSNEINYHEIQNTL